MSLPTPPGRPPGRGSSRVTANLRTQASPSLEDEYPLLSSFEKNVVETGARENVSRRETRRRSWSAAGVRSWELDERRGSWVKRGSS